jgi:DnaK suppressor protein
MQVIKFPRKILQPIEQFLREREQILTRRKHKLLDEDPFNNPERSLDLAAVDAEANDRVDHDRVAAMTMEVDRALLKIRQALERITIGRYGLCEECGTMIDTDRLAIDPAASFCVACEQKRDQNQKRT